MISVSIILRTSSHTVSRDINGKGKSFVRIGLSMFSLITSPEESVKTSEYSQSNVLISCFSFSPSSSLT